MSKPKQIASRLNSTMVGASTRMKLVELMPAATPAKPGQVQKEPGLIGPKVRSLHTIISQGVYKKPGEVYSPLFGLWADDRAKFERFGAVHLDKASQTLLNKSLITEQSYADADVNAETHHIGGYKAVLVGGGDIIHVEKTQDGNGRTYSFAEFGNRQSASSSAIDSVIALYRVVSHNLEVTRREQTATKIAATQRRTSDLQAMIKAIHDQGKVADVTKLVRNVTENKTRFVGLSGLKPSTRTISRLEVAPGVSVSSRSDSAVVGLTAYFVGVDGLTETVALKRAEKFLHDGRVDLEARAEQKSSAKKSSAKKSSTTKTTPKKAAAGKKAATGKKAVAAKKGKKAAKAETSTSPKKGKKAAASASPAKKRGRPPGSSNKSSASSTKSSKSPNSSKGGVTTPVAGSAKSSKARGLLNKLK